MGILARVISIILIPALFTWLPAPKERHLTHLDRMWVERVVGTFVQAVQFGRTRVYLLALVVVAIMPSPPTLVDPPGSSISSEDTGGPTS